MTPPAALPPQGEQPTAETRVAAERARIDLFVEAWIEIREEHPGAEDYSYEAHCSLCGSWTRGPGNSAERWGYEHMSEHDAAHASVLTVEELDRLPQEAVLKTRYGSIAIKLPYESGLTVVSRWRVLHADSWLPEYAWGHEGDFAETYNRDIDLPALVLWNPAGKF